MDGETGVLSVQVPVLPRESKAPGYHLNCIALVSVNFAP